MKTERTYPRHDNVTFRFAGTEEDTYLTGTVLFRDGEMVLDILGGDGPYLIIGKACKHWFEGTNSSKKGRNEVTAKWAKVGEGYVGTWIEHDNEFLFRFDTD